MSNGWQCVTEAWEDSEAGYIDRGSSAERDDCESMAARKSIKGQENCS